MNMHASSLVAVLVMLILSPGAAHGLQPEPSEGLTFGSLPDLPDPVGFGGPIVGVHEGALIVAGGANFPTPLAEGGAKVWHDQVFVLLARDEAWRTGQELPTPLAYAACVSTERGVVIAGGSDAESVSSDVWLMRWDSKAEQVSFEALPPLPEASAFGAAEAIGSVVYVLAGKRSKDESDLSGGFWKLDLDAPEFAWTALPAHPGPVRCKMVTAIQNGPDGERCLFMFSGSQMTQNAEGDLHFAMYTDGYRYSPGANEWAKIADLPVLDDPRDISGEERFADERWPINAACAMAYGTNEILTFSGSTGRYILDIDGQLVPASDRPFFSNRVLSYNTVDDTWTEREPMPVGVVTTNAVVWNGHIVIPSGEIKPGIRTPVVQKLALPESVELSPQFQARFGIMDYTVLSLYLALVVGVGVYFAKREKSTEEFFLAGRKIPWWAAGLSIFGTQLSAITFMAIPATAYGSDWRRFIGHLMLLPVIVVVITCFLPFFRKLNITTAYEFLEARFSLTVRLSASTLFVVFQLFRMGIVMLLPAIALAAVTGIDVYLCIALMGVLATLYTALGGISAVIWTDVVQVFVLIGGATLCLVIAVVDAGGVGQALDIAEAANKFKMFEWNWGVTDMVAWVLVIGFLFTNFVPYATDQSVIQRYLVTRDEKQAARSLWLNLALTIPTGLLFYGLGTALFVYYASHPMEQAAVPDRADQLVPWFVVSHLPAGIAGLVVAGIFAAAMSSLDSSMNSITTVIVNDFVKRLRGDCDDLRLLRLAKGLTIVLGVIGTSAALILATYEMKYIFDFFQSIIGLFGGALAGVFMLAVFTRRANATGALVGLGVGGGVTIGVAYLTEVNFLLYAGIGSITCVTSGYIVSMLTGGQTPKGAGLTIWSAKESRNEP